MIVILFPALVAVVGALAYALATNGKVAEMGRIAFAVGLLVTVYAMAAHDVLHVTTTTR